MRGFVLKGGKRFAGELLNLDEGLEMLLYLAKDILQISILAREHKLDQVPVCAVDRQEEEPIGLLSIPFFYF